MRGKFLCVLLLMLTVSPAFSYTYRGNARRSQPANDSEYESLLAKFPNHKNVIDKLYAKYSGWVIEISERYGILPLLAASGSDDAENVLPLLSRYGETFTEIFGAIGGLRLSETSRAETALDFLTAFTVADSDDKAEYYSAVKSAGLKDSRMTLTGRRANYYARKIPDSRIMPANFLRELKAEYPEIYSKLLHEISHADYDTLKAICDYPNGLTLLLNTGREGVRLIDETDGQIIVLSWFLPDDVQRELPGIFRRYPKLSEALKICGADSFFTVMLCPELFFTLTEFLDGTNHERFTMSYAVILSQANSGDDAVNFLKSLTANDSRKIARYTAEIMNLPDDDSGGIPAPLSESMFMRFVLRYGDEAAEMCRNFSPLLDVSKLLISDWHGNFQDVSPVIEAAKDFGLMGLQAAIHFRFAEDMQKFILSYSNPSRRRDLLMFMLYDDVSGHSYTENISSRSDGAKYMLENYTIDRNTGEPVQIEESTAEHFAGYIPGHDVIAPIYNYMHYGKTPTVMECLNGALDLMDIIPMATAAVTITRAVAKGNGKKILTVYAKKAVNEAIESAGETAANIFSDIAEFSLDRMKKNTSRFFRKIGTRSAVFISEMSLPSWENISDFTKYMADKAKGLSINVIDISRKKPELSKLYSKPWMTKRATDYLINESFGIIQKAAVKETIHIIGINSVMNHLAVK